MTSQAEIDDEILARRLQSEEFANQSAPNNHGSSTQSMSDEEFARRLAREEQLAAARVIAASSSTAGSQFSLRAGQSTPVRLHHPLTNRQIGEVVLANHVSSDEMTFELTNAPGKYLKVRQSGGVEFDYGLDGPAVFKVENAATRGSLHFASKAFISAVNRNGGSGWYISMTMGGQLIGNGGRNQESEWVLVAANSVVAPRPASLSRGPSYNAGVIAGSAVVSPITPMPAVVTSTTPSANLVQAQKFPGFAAGREELMKFFATSSGQTFLQQPDYQAANALYRNKASLANILHRPDWPVVANRYQEFLNLMNAMATPGASAAVVVGNSGASDLLDLGNDNNASLENEAVAFRQYFAQGYAILPNVVPKHLVDAAVKMVNFWLFKYATTPFGAPVGANPVAAPQGISKGIHYTMDFHGDITKDIDILSLYYRTALPQLVEKLIGQGDVMHPKHAQIVSIYPCIELLTTPPALQVDKWNIEGFTPHGGHSPYNMLIGIALTDISEADMGNFCVHPESHYVLLDQYRRQAEEKNVLFSSNPYEFKKPDLGLPTQLRLRAGDVFLCTQRLAYVYGTNTTFNPSTIVFFRVSSVDHDIMKDPALYSLWLEYKHASKYMDATLEERSIIAMPEATMPPEERGTIAYPAATIVPAVAAVTASSHTTPLPVSSGVISPRPSFGGPGLELRPMNSNRTVASSSTSEDCLLGGSYENIHHSTATATVTTTSNPMYGNAYVAHDPHSESVGLLNVVGEDEDDRL